MTIKELKEALANADPNAEVSLSYCGYQTLHGMQREEADVTAAALLRGKLVLKV